MWSNNIRISWLLVWLQVGYDLQGRLLVPFGATILGHLDKFHLNGPSKYAFIRNNWKIEHPNVLKWQKIPPAL